MMIFLQKFIKIRYWAEEKAVAAVETAVIFPFFIGLLMAVYDLGQGITINQKAIASAQVVGDLVARNKEMTMGILDDITRAGRMALEPYDTTDYGYDIVSLRFDEDGNAEVLWRVTENMNPNNAAVESADILELTNEGLVVVTTSFGYTPLFSEFLVDQVDMQEVAFLRGRKNSIIFCDDCPGG